MVEEKAPARRVSPNDKIRFAVIGAGWMGSENVTAALETGEAEFAGAADVYQGRLDRVREIWGGEVHLSRDYRDILARTDIDTVIVAVPDHLHAAVALDAMSAGKDVYCEKPMVQKIEDGHQVIAAASATGAVFQAGSQRVSSVVYAKARQLFASGAIGQVTLVEAWWNRNSALGAWQYSIPPDASPATIDWVRFLGPAGEREFDPLRLFRWRNYPDYGTGVAGDLFVHLFSGLHFITGATGPGRIYATGGLRYWKDGREVPDVMLGLYDYPATDSCPAFNLALQVNFADGAGESSGFRFIGTEGVMTVDPNVRVVKAPREKEPGHTAQFMARQTREQFAREYYDRYPVRRASPEGLETHTEQLFLKPQGYRDLIDHHRNFFSAVRGGQTVVEDAVFGLRACAPALLSNTSYFTGRPCYWDAENMKETR